ncbi:hypothetical protein DFH06DRAFT_1141833 [Mycena polygramma]|nr:hypothetical protein DFH06DRAFT_1141833 [Mycena polygramma]
MSTVPRCARPSQPALPVVHDFRALQLSRWMPTELWTKVFRQSVTDPMVDSKLHAGGRAILCGLSRETRTLVHMDSTFWSFIHLDTAVWPSALKFVLERLSETAPVHLKITLGDLAWDRHRGDPSILYGKISELFSLLLPLASRWETFCVSTEHPSLFCYIRDLCADLDAPVLRSVQLCYIYMPDYSDFDIPGPMAYLLPFNSSRPWFGNRFKTITNLSLVGTLIRLRTPHLVDHLVEVEVADMDADCDFGWADFAALFESAGNLSTLKIGIFAPFEVPFGPAIVSHSITSFDIAVRRSSSSYLTKLVERIRMPCLRNFTVRCTLWSDCSRLVRWGHLLGGVQHFELHGPCHDRLGLARVFDLMPGLKSLDLSRAPGSAFVAFLEWSVAKTMARPSGSLLPLTSLCVAHETPEDLLAIVALYRFGDSSPGKLRLLQLERPSWTLVIAQMWTLVIAQISSPAERLELPDTASNAHWYSPTGMHLTTPASRLSSGESQVPRSESPAPPDVPREMVNLVLDFTADHRGFDDGEAFIVNRSAVMSLSKVYSKYVKARPFFWDHIVVTPENVLHLPVVVAPAASLPLYITLNIPRPSSAISTDWLDSHYVTTAYMDRATTAVRPYVSRCAGLTLEAPTLRMVQTLLRSLRDAPPTVLQYLAVKFKLPTLGTYSDGALTWVGFDIDPPFGPVFSRYDLLTIQPTTEASSHCAVVSSSTSSCTLYQSAYDRIAWTSFVGIVDHLGYFQRVELRNVKFATDTQYALRTSKPISSIDTLSLAFEGNFSMAESVSCLVLPNLTTLILHIGSRQDWECLSACGVFLSTVLVVQLIVDSHTTAIDHYASYRLFSLLHNVHRLDLHLASPSVLYALFSASCILPEGSASSGGMNWNACPNLTQLDLGEVNIDLVSQLVYMRKTSGYRQMVSLSLGSFLECSKLREDDWFISHQLRRNVYTAV